MGLCIQDIVLNDQDRGIMMWYIAPLRDRNRKEQWLLEMTWRLVDEKKCAKQRRDCAKSNKTTKRNEQHVLGARPTN